MREIQNRKGKKNKGEEYRNNTSKQKNQKGEKTRVIEGE